jgi:hypothetical protein
MIAVLLLACTLFLWKLFGDDTSSRGLPVKGKIPSIAQWQARAVHRGLTELSEPANQRLPPLAITEAKPKSMPRAMRDAIHKTIGDASILHLSFDRSYLAQMPIGGALWIVEGSGVICAFRDQLGTSTCQTNVQARKHGLLLEVFRPSRKPEGRPTHFLALGIAPNWVRSVAVKVGHIRRTIPVISHRYALTAKRPIEITQLLR